MIDDRLGEHLRSVGGQIAPSAPPIRSIEAAASGRARLRQVVMVFAVTVGVLVIGLGIGFGLAELSG